jgi:hypothetical protein
MNLRAGLGALYNDEGARYLTENNNVLENAGAWSFQNASPTNHTGDITLIGNWTNVPQGIMNGVSGCVVMGTVVVTNGMWPPAAQRVIDTAGLEPAFADLKSP